MCVCVRVCACVCMCVCVCVCVHVYSHTYLSMPVCSSVSDFVFCCDCLGDVSIVMCMWKWYHAVCGGVVQWMRVYTCVCVVPCCVCCCCARDEGVHVCVHGTMLCVLLLCKR